MKCGRCATDNPNTSLFCGACANPLSKSASPSLVPTVVSATREIPTSDPSNDDRFLPGTLLADRYRIISKLGAGGMGEVYRATDLRLGQQVALKFLPEEMADDPKSLERFHTEVRIARQVAHPNVCRVYDIGEVDGVPYLSMEYVDGEDLNSLLRRIGRLPEDKALEISRKLCAGLAAAHDKGVLHRDLKPGNIMIDGRGQVLITDFGLAGLMGHIEGAETRNGTPGYMAPEQLSGKEVSTLSDVYALGVVLYEMFTGKRPFQAATRAELMRLVEAGTPPAPRKIVKDIDPAIENVILRCLAPDPRFRPASALSVSAALPGGDPLAAALAAGETPSPEMVAAAGQKVGLKPGIAMACLAAVFAGIAIFAPINQRVNLLAKIPMENPPEVLLAKSRELVQKLGYVDPPAGIAYGFQYRYETISLIERQYQQRSDAQFAKGRPVPLAFWYRSSPQAMIPHSNSEIPRVTRDDPPEDVPGMLHVALDQEGRLGGFTAVPPERDSSPGPWPAPDWNILFAAAGLDVATFQTAQPQWTPAVMSDTRAAWTGHFPEAPEIRLRFEAAAFHGKPVSLIEILEPERASGSSTGLVRRTPGGLIYVMLEIIILIGSFPFARYNLRLSRGDTRGAARLGIFALGICLASWLIGGAHVAGAGETTLFRMAASRAVFGSVTLGLTYISFEPFVRARWPQTIISWSRVLTGKFRDPLVGRDVLLGVLVGVALALIQVFGSLMYTMVGIPAVRVTTDVVTLAGGRFLTGQFLYMIADSLNKALSVLFLVFLARTILRKLWLAAGVVVVVLAAVYAVSEINPFIGWPVNLLFFTLLVFTLMRFGLLSVAIAIFVMVFLNLFPMTTDFSAWFLMDAAFTVILTAAIAIYGFRTALAGQPLFKTE